MFLWVVNFFCATVWMGNIEICRMHIDTWKTKKSAWQCSTAKKMLVNSVNCEAYVTIQSTSATHSLKSVTYNSSLTPQNECLAWGVKPMVPTNAKAGDFFTHHCLKTQPVPRFSGLRHGSFFAKGNPKEKTLEFMLHATSMMEHLHLQHFKWNREGWNWKFFCGNPSFSMFILNLRILAVFTSPRYHTKHGS